MLDTSNPYAVLGREAVAQQDVNVRTAFIRRTYAHLAGALAAFVVIEAFLLTVVPTDAVMQLISGRFSWLVVLGLFMGISWVANMWAHSNTSKGIQYLGLGLYVVAEAVIFLPMMIIATRLTESASLPITAGVITGFIFGGLTLITFVTRADFSWLGKFLTIAGFAALGLIVCSAIFGFNLGILFSVVMVGFAATSILYNTSNILHHYNPNQHVAASLALFASVALLFWYVLQLLLSFSQD